MAKIVDKEFHRRASESVLIQSRSATARDPVFEAATTDVVRRLTAITVVTGVESPLERGNADQISGDRHSALVKFHIRGDPDKASGKIGPVLDAVQDAQKANPGVSIGGFGEATANKQIMDRVLTVGAVEKHIANIFMKLGLAQSETDHRRVLAVLAYVQQQPDSAG